MLPLYKTHHIAAERAADRAASEFKRKLRNWLASGSNAETPEQLFSALTEGRFPKAMSSYLCTIDYSTVKEGKSDIKGIQNLYDFRFDMKNSKMTARKFGKIGEGSVHDTKKFMAGTGEMKIEKSGGYHNSDQETFWKSSKCTKKCSEEDIEVQERAEEVNPFEDTDVNVEEPVPTPIETAVFECPEEGCTALFTKYGNLERHLALDKHNFVPEKETLLDFAMNRYAENIEGLRQTPIPCSLKDALTEIPPGTLPFDNLQGWALPHKKTNKRYNRDVVQFVKEKFEEAAKKKLKFYPKLIATEIREQKKDGKLQFPPDTWLNYKQIQNLYNTFGRKSRDLSAKKKETVATSTQIPATLPSSIRTPANRETATAAAHDSKSSSNKME
ncbi:hypothetical protein CRE_23622 [Caenorhabditis remanei]|uniref:C2H2-type domain-containing protein n=1 Tax=Caenorhabditis remanei TaxID=31234 RepID=E3MVX2_CAERE|nr:hypothetical protein CRE_23622 [Caenorhabditis remanei]